MEAHPPLVSRVAVLDKVTDFLFFLGKLLIVGSVGKCCVLEVSPRGIRLLSLVVLSQKCRSSHPSCEASPFHPVFHPRPSLAFPGILAFFFFTQRIKLVQDTAPPLNYYWVPILVSCPLSLGVTLEGEDRDAPHKPLPMLGTSRTFFVGGVFPVAGAMSPLLAAAGAAPACAAHFGLHPVGG